MKLVLAVLLGLLLAANVAADDDDDEGGHHYPPPKKCGHTVYSCVKSEEHCWKEEVCEEGEKVACGDDWCAYPAVCKYDTTKRCKNVTKFRKECAAPTHTCVQDLTECGDDECTYDEECKATKVCKIVEQKVQGYTEPASASASASAVANGGPASAKASAVAVSTGTTYTLEPVKICHKEYECVPKDPCETVYAQKCVHADLVEDKVYGSKTFEWLKPWEVGQKCGKGYCKEGYKCANVAKKVCPEGVACGEKTCDPGYKCDLEEVHCKEIPYVAPVCEDVKIGKCYMPHDWVDYKPACKTIWKCKEVECGGGYCPAGAACKADWVPCKPAPKPKRSSGDDDD